MTKPTIRETRLAYARQMLAKKQERRDHYIKLVARNTAAIKRLERQIARLEKPAPVRKAEAKADLAVTDKDGMPEFLKRKREGEAKDAADRAAILADQDARKLAKSRARIATMKAKRAGETRRMPLAGKAALAAIRGEV